jgi:hypothetical protein
MSNTFSIPVAHLLKSTKSVNSIAMDRYEKRRLMLKAATDEYGRGGIAKVAKLCDIDPSYLSRLLYPQDKKGHKRIGEDVQEKLERGLGKPAGWLDSADQYNNDGIEHIGGYGAQGGPVVEQENRFSIISYDDVRASMGRGIVLQDQPGQITKIDVTDEWLLKNVPVCTSKHNLRIVTGFGDSMRGMFNSGDPLLVDVGVEDCNHDGLYFFRVGDEGFIKLLQRIPTVGIKVISKNPDYETWTITKDMDFQVIAKVLKVWESTKY